MKNMTRILACAALAGVMAFALTGCGSEKGGSADKADQTKTEETATEAPTVDGELIDTGVISAVCPDGWAYFPQSDYFADADEDGNYPEDPSTMLFVQGAESEWDAFSKPCVYVYLKDGAFTDDDIEMNKIFYDSAEDFDIQINGEDAVGFTASTASYVEEGEDYVYDVVFYQISADQYLQFNITVNNDGQGVSAQDPDVVTIMNSVAID